LAEGTRASRHSRAGRATDIAGDALGARVPPVLARVREDTRAERIAGDMDRFVRLKVTVTGARGDTRRTELVSPISPGWG
jgi:hypothetical protein